MVKDKRVRPAHLRPVPNHGETPTPATKNETLREERERRRAERADAHEYATREILPRLTERIAVLNEPAGLLLYERGGKVQLKKPSELRALFAAIPGFPPHLRIHPLDWYLTHEGRREFERVVFAPGGAQPDEYNLWRGFAVEPRKGSCVRFWELTRDVICASNDEHYRYIRKCLAFLVQHPEKRWEIALVLHSIPGTGKNMWVDYIGELFGEHYVTVNATEQLTGRFNALHARAILLFANEAIWGGDKTAEGRFKSLITDETVALEHKGKDPVPIANLRHLIIASNEDFPAPVGRRDRRIVYLEVSESRIGDDTFFESIMRERKNGGPSALLAYLLTEPLDEWRPNLRARGVEAFHPRNRPATARSEDLAHRSFGSIERFIAEALNRDDFRYEVREQSRERNAAGAPPDRSDRYKTVPWGGEHQRAVVYDAYRDFCRDRGFRTPEGDARFFRELYELGLSQPGPRRQLASGERVRTVVLLARSAAIEAFCVKTGQVASFFESFDDDYADDVGVRLDSDGADGTDAARLPIADEATDLEREADASLGATPWGHV